MSLKKVLRHCGSPKSAASTLVLLSGQAFACGAVLCFALCVGPAQASAKLNPLYQSVSASADKAVPAPPRKTTAPHSRKVGDEPQGIALSAPASTAAHSEKGLSQHAASSTEETAASDEKKKPTRSKAKTKKSKSKKISKQKKRRPAKKSMLAPTPEETPAQQQVASNAESDLMQVASEKMNAGAYDDAAQLYEKRLAEAPSDAQAFRQRARALQKVGTPEALKALQEMVDRDKAPNGAAYAALAQAKSQAGDQKEAISLMWKALAVEPHNDQYRLTLAILFDRAGQTDMALSLYNQLHQGVPDEIQKRVRYLQSK